MVQLKRTEASAKFPASPISDLIAKLLVIDIFQTEESLNKSLSKSTVTVCSQTVASLKSHMAYLIPC